MRTEIQNCSAVILSAGKSSRAGFPKALLKVREGISFLEKLIALFQNSGCEKIIVVLNEELKMRLEVVCQAYPEAVVFVVNPDPDRGRLSSLQAGLMRCKSEFCFFHNIDNPFVGEGTLRSLYEARHDGAVVPAVHGKKGHPVLLGKKMICQIQMTEDLTADIRDLLGTNLTIVETEDESILLNINTPEEYHQQTGYEIPAEQPH